MSTRCTNFRVPPRITTFPQQAISNSNCIFSVELSESVSRLGDLVFAACPSLRNITIPSDSEIVLSAFDKCTDLKQLFGTQAQIISTLKHRFGNLPIHKIIYYHSYNSLTSEQLGNATNMRSGQSRPLRSKLDPTGNRQDSLGMTPLHILACSSVQNIELY